MTRFVRFATMLFVWGVFALPAAAQGLGVRAGASVDPDQFYFGGHLDTGPIADKLHFRPNVEIGLGDDVTVVGFNIEFVYMFPPKAGWSLYGGGGPALNIIDTDIETNSEGGFNLVGGVEHEKGLFGEVKLGFSDSPEFKVGVGYTIKWR